MNRILVGIVLGLIGSTPLYALSAEAALIQKLNAIHSLSAEFNQTVKAQHREVSRAQGHMSLERPGHFRWETKRPTAQLLLADGKQVWVYDPDLEQVIIKPQGKALQGTPALFLSAPSDSLANDFHVKLDSSNAAQTYHLQAKTPHQAFTQVTLTFQGAQLQSILLEDQLGQKTDVQLKQVKQNQQLPTNAFKFKPPRGIDVIRE